MKANELADMLAKSSIRKVSQGEVVVDVFEIATMLRNQQAEIETLKQIIDANNLSQNIGQFVKPANEPVAWISVLGIDHIGQKFTDVRVSLTKTDVASIPLYTHPVKELTDEEIDMLAHEYNCIDDYPHEFVRACIKKAQER